MDRASNHEHANLRDQSKEGKTARTGKQAGKAQASGWQGHRRPAREASKQGRPTGNGTAEFKLIEFPRKRLLQ